MSLLYEALKVENRKLVNVSFHNERMNRSRRELLGISEEIDLAAFTAKMVRMATDSDLRKRMSIAARNTSELYDYRRTNQLLYELYERVINDTSRRRRSIRARWIRFWDQWR